MKYLMLRSARQGASRSTHHAPSRPIRRRLLDSFTTSEDGQESLRLVRREQSWAMLCFNGFGTPHPGTGKRPRGRNRMLTSAQRAAYDRDGFIVVPEIFSAEDLAELRWVTDEFVSASATVTANDSVYDLEDTHSADEPRVRRLK